MFKWFMTKTLITKIIIVTSSVVIIGGTTAGAIIVPKVIETKKEEQRQEQIRLENEEDLANISITLKRDKIYGITFPYKGVTQGVSIERYENFEKYLIDHEGNNPDYGNKEALDKELINFFEENYTGGEITVEQNIDINTRGEYPVVFTVTSEKGNTKSATIKVTVWNYSKVNVYVDKTDITVTKGTNVDIMEGVTFDSILPEEEKGHIETVGTVDVNTAGTYTIIYKYIPKDEHEGVISEGTRTYKVVDETNVNNNKTNSNTTTSSNNNKGNNNNNSNNSNQSKTETTENTVQEVFVSVSANYLSKLANINPDDYLDNYYRNISIKINGISVCNGKFDTDTRHSGSNVFYVGTYTGKVDHFDFDIVFEGRKITQKINYQYNDGHLEIKGVNENV